MKLLLVIFGGFLGSICRFALGEWLYINDAFPVSTFLINLIGCFFLGWFMTYISRKVKIRGEFTLFIGTGIIGSFTTFSTFSVETLNLFQKGLMFTGILYVLTSTVLGIVLVFLGHKLALQTKNKTGAAI